MMTVPDNPIVGDYLRRLEEAARDLPADRRAELVRDVREHIAVATAEAPPASDAETLQMLDRLGEPEEIVGSARAEGGLAVSGPAPSLPRNVAHPALDGLTVALLLVGGFIVGIGWLAGVVLLWSSPTWRLRHRIAGTFVVPGGLLLPAFMGLFSNGSCTQTARPVRSGAGPGAGAGAQHCSTVGPAIGLGVGLVLAAASISCAIYLARRAYLAHR